MEPIKFNKQNIIDYLESEKPMQEGLEEEIQGKRKKLIEVFGQMNGEQVLALKDFARHFAQWGVEHRGSSEIPKDLEDASLVYGLSVPCEYPPVTDAEGGEHPVFDLTAVENAFIAGAKWQKEQDDRLVDIIYQQGIEKGKDEIRKTLKRKEKK